MTDQAKMKVLREETVAPAGYFSAEIRKGQVLRIVDVEGQQVADLVTINAGNIAEKLSVMNTINLNKQVFPRVGYVLYSDEARGMMTIIADTCGVHDMLAGACSSFTNEKRYGVKDTKNCRDNLAAALKPWGITWKDVPFNMNVFMNCPIGSDGNWSIQVPKSKAGDYIDFRAEMNVIAAFSNCPQVHNACNGFRLKPLLMLEVTRDYRMVLTVASSAPIFADLRMRCRQLSRGITLRQSPAPPAGNPPLRADGRIATCSADTHAEIHSGRRLLDIC
jgi:urea carboxylase-associated protein 1